MVHCSYLKFTQYSITAYTWVLNVSEKMADDTLGLNQLVVGGMGAEPQDVAEQIHTKVSTMPVVYDTDEAA